MSVANLKGNKMKMPNLGDKVTLSDHSDACVYTVAEVYTSKGMLWVQLIYINDGGMLVKAGGVDATLLMQPTVEQLNNSEVTQ